MKTARTSQNQGNGQIFREVPVYGQTSPEIGERLDEIIQSFNKYDPEAGITFGDSSLAERNAVAENILAAQQADRFNFVKEPLKAAAGFMDGIDLNNISTKVSAAMNKGGAALKRNPLLLAGAAGLSLISVPFAVVAGTTAIALKERARSLRERGQPETVEQLSDRLNESISGFAPMMRNLDFAWQQLPEMRQNINSLGRTNVQALNGVTLYISAGREILRQLTEEDIPNTSADDADTLKVTAYNLERKLPILEQVRNSAIMDVTILASLTTTVTDIGNSLQSILTLEASNHRASLVAQGAALATLQVAELTEQFRQKAEKGAQLAIEATNRAQQVAAASRVDSPERLQATIDNLDRVKRILEQSMLALPAAEANQKLLREQVSRAASGVVDAQVAASRLAANGNTPVLISDRSVPRLERK